MDIWNVSKNYKGFIKCAIIGYITFKDDYVITKLNIHLYESVKYPIVLNIWDFGVFIDISTPNVTILSNPLSLECYFDNLDFEYNEYDIWESNEKDFNNIMKINNIPSDKYEIFITGDICADLL